MRAKFRMGYDRLSRLSPFLISMAMLLASCAGEPPIIPSSPPANARLGPTLELLSIKTATDHIYTLTDRQGNAHVFIAAANTKEIYHVVVGADNSVQREIIVSGSSPSSVSAAFDAGYNLHLLLDKKHLVFEGSEWKASPDTPWEVAGINVHTPKLVQGSKGLVWSFLVDGKEVGAQGRWDWYGFGGGPAGILFPWHATSKKLVIVPEAAMAEPPWYVVDPQDSFDISDAMLATDNNDNLYIFYDASSSGLAAERQPRYAQIYPMVPPTHTDRDKPVNMAGNKHLLSVRGQPVPGGLKRSDLNQSAMAIDPETGSMLLVRAHDSSLVLKNGKWSLPQRLPLSRFWEPRLATAGQDDFHAMMLGTAVPEEWWKDASSVLYLRFNQGTWSAPVILGQAEVSSIWGSMWAALGIASNGSNRVFIVWPTKTAIVGRWVDDVIERK